MRFGKGGVPRPRSARGVWLLLAVLAGLLLALLLLLFHLLATRSACEQASGSAHTLPFLSSNLGTKHVRGEVEAGADRELTQGDGAAAHSEANAYSPPQGKQRIIFGITTGHTASRWLAFALQCGVGVVSKHEPQPSMVEHRRIIFEGHDATYQRRWDGKIPALEQEIASANGSTYIEISQMFTKSWSDVAMDWAALNSDKYEVEFIVLHRWLPLVLRSYLTKDGYWNLPFEKFHGGEYTLHHRQVAILPPLGEYGTVDFVDTAAGYLFDMHAHFDVFLKQHPNNKVWDVDAESIYSRQGIEHLLRSMGFGVNDKCVQSLLNVGTSNDHVNWQKPELLELREEVFLARLYNVAHKFDKYGYKFAEADYMLKKVMCLESVNGMCRQPLVKFSYKQMEQLLNVTIPGNGFPPVSDVSRQNDEAIKKSKK